MHLILSDIQVEGDFAIFYPQVHRVRFHQEVSYVPLDKQQYHLYFRYGLKLR